LKKRRKDKKNLEESSKSLRSTLMFSIRSVFMLALIIGGSVCGSLSVLTGALYLLFEATNYILTIVTIKIA
jgi:Co/Zn/Cd efflux system component